MMERGRVEQCLLGFRSRAGFSLIEMIATLVLVAVLAALFLAVLPRGVGLTVQNRGRLAAAYETRAEMERLIQIGLVALESGESLDDIRNTLTASVAAGFEIGFPAEVISGDLPELLYMTLNHPLGGELVYVFWEEELTP